MTTLALETWRAVPEWPEYEVSDIGRVRRVGKAGGARVGRVLMHWLTLGYPYVSLWRSNKKSTVAIHRLVAVAFLPAPGEGQYQVAHRDGDKTNNVPSNLRWATPVENADDRHQHGTHALGESNPQSKLTTADVHAIRAAAGRRTQQLVADDFGVSRAAVNDIVNGRRWGHL